MEPRRKSIIGLLLTMGIVLAGIGFVYAQTATDADFDGSGEVEFSDFLLFVSKFGARQGDGKYEARYDLNGNGEIDFPDFLLFVGFFGQKAGPNLPPVALAGEDQSVDKRETITLDGSNSNDPEGQPLTFSWRQIAGEQVVLSDPEIARPTFSTLDPGNYAFELVVHDGVTASVPDTVVVDIVSIADVVVKVGSPDAAFVYKETTGNQMTFSVQGTAPPVQVGEVMVNTVEPYFLKKVTQVISQDANEIVVETQDAALTDVIEEATIRRTFQVPATKLALASPIATGPIILHSDASARLSLTNCDISLSREYRYGFYIDIKGFTLNSFELGIKGDLVATLEMELEAYRAVSLNADKTLGQWPPISFDMPLGPINIPVTVQGEFGVGADFSAEATGRITSGISMTKPIAIGVEYKDGAFQELTGGSPATYDVQDPVLDLQGSASVRGYVRGQLDAEVLHVGGPYFGVSSYLGFDAVTNQEQKQIDWRLHTGVDGYAGVKATIFDKIGITGIDADTSWEFNLFMALLKEGVIPLETSQREALVALYNATEGANWRNNTNWLSDAPIGDWHGVTTSNEGEVLGLSLRDNNLRGSIPPELCNLTKLEQLQLDNNQLSGEIPPELGNLSNLTSLWLSRNQLSGEIPSTLGNLSNLTFLSIWNTQLSGSIPPQLGNLSNLTFLQLPNNQLSGEIPPQLGNLSNLTYLDLSRNQLTGSIPPELGNLSNLTFLWLSRNQLSGEIPSTLGNLSNLTFLGLSSNQLSGSIPSQLGNLSNLTDLRLYANQLSGSIPPQLGNLSNLTFLSLSSNQLSGSIPPQLGNLSNLTDLRLYINQLSGSIPPQLGNLSNLTDLRLYANQLSGSIPPQLGNLSNLTFLGLSSNQLSGSIPPELGNLSNLTDMQLYANQLSGSIPSQLGNLSNLERLWLHNNQLSGALPQSLTMLTMLENFRFEGGGLCAPSDAAFQAWLQGIEDVNGPTCPLPGQREALVALYNATDGANWTNNDNWLTDNDISYWHGVKVSDGSVTGLHLGGNNLTGEIPTELGNLTNLEELRLYNNQLSGALPQSLTGLTKLREFFFNNTELCAPRDPAFQAWLKGIDSVRGSNCSQ